MTKKTEKKERVIHTRISESLDEELKERASALGVSVSNLVRNILTNTIELVEEIVSDSAAVARSARGARSPAQPAGTGSVIGWQTVVLNLNALCEQCNAILPKGTEAAIAVTDGAGPRPIRCLACLQELRDEPTDTE